MTPEEPTPDTTMFEQPRDVVLPTPQDHSKLLQQFAALRRGQTKRPDVVTSKTIPYTFDKMCAIADKAPPLAELAMRLRTAALFKLESPDVEQASSEFGELDIEDASRAVREFFLPFPCVAVEALNICTVLWSATDVEIEAWRAQCDRAGQPELKSADTKVFSYVVVGSPYLTLQRSMKDAAYAESMATSPEFKQSTESIKRLVEDNGVDAVVVSRGLFSLDGIIPATTAEGRRWSIYIVPATTHLFTETRMRRIDVVPRHLKERHDEFVTRDLTATVKALWVVNQPSRFIFESSPVKMRDPLRSPKIPRVQDRPVYCVLRPADIRTRYLGESADSAETHSKAAHARRAHVRVLRSDKYVNAKGKTILVPATWVGPSEAVVGRRRYRVLLDK